MNGRGKDVECFNCSARANTLQQIITPFVWCNSCAVVIYGHHRITMVMHMKPTFFENLSPESQLRRAELAEALTQGGIPNLPRQGPRALAARGRACFFQCIEIVKEFVLSFCPWGS